MAYKILVADDEADFELLLSQKFRKKIRDGEWAFEFVRNGAEALSKLQSDTSIDLILTDINMPVMDGLTFLNRIREENFFHKAIVVSAYGDMINIRTAMNRGAFDFVVKPIDFGDLDITLNKTIEEMVKLKEALLIRDQLEKARQEKEDLILSQNKMLEQKVAERTSELTAEKKKSDDLLLNILPEEVAEELKLKGKAAARQFENVTVLFTDFVNFTSIAEKLSIQELVTELDRCFKAFDEITERYGLEKIKTIGDAYLAVSGLPTEDPKHAANAIHAAIEIRNFIRESNSSLVGVSGSGIRIGLHSGAVVAGIVGFKKFAYDIWGDTVNTASRMESKSEPGKINISGATYEIVKDEFNCEYRGKIEAKNKGMIDMYFVER